MTNYTTKGADMECAQFITPRNLDCNEGWMIIKPDVENVKIYTTCNNFDY